MVYELFDNVVGAKPLINFHKQKQNMVSAIKWKLRIDNMLFLSVKLKLRILSAKTQLYFVDKNSLGTVYSAH